MKKITVFDVGIEYYKKQIKGAELKASDNANFNVRKDENGNYWTVYFDKKKDKYEDFERMLIFHKPTFREKEKDIYIKVTYDKPNSKTFAEDIKTNKMVTAEEAREKGIEVKCNTCGVLLTPKKYKIKGEENKFKYSFCLHKAEKKVCCQDMGVISAHRVRPTKEKKDVKQYVKNIIEIKGKPIILNDVEYDLIGNQYLKERCTNLITNKKYVTFGWIARNFNQVIIDISENIDEYYIMKGTYKENVSVFKGYPIKEVNDFYKVLKTTEKNFIRQKNILKKDKNETIKRIHKKQIEDFEFIKTTAIYEQYLYKLKRGELDD